MLFHNFLEALLASKVKVKILRLISRLPEKTWTSRELAKFIGVSNMSVLRSLVDLEGMNLIDISRAGNSYLIKVKRSGFIFSSVLKPLFDAERFAFDGLVKDLKEMVPPRYVAFYALFGSVAGKTESQNSDIDVLIVTEKPGAIEKIITEKQSLISQKYGNRLSPYIMTVVEFRKKQGVPFLKEAKKNHVVLAGRWI